MSDTTSGEPREGGSTRRSAQPSMSNVILEIRSGDAMRGHLLGDNYIAPMGR